MSAKLVLLAGATVVSLVFGSVGAAAALPEGFGAASPARQNAYVYGVIETVEDQGVALATPIGMVDLIVDANTRFRIPDVKEPSLDDLAVGDSLAATGWWEGEVNVFHAFGVARLVDDDRVFPLPGKLVGVGDATLTVETRRGVATVHLDADTAYRIRGQGESELGDLEVGMHVVVQGMLNADGSLQAQVVVVPGVGPRLVRAQGEVLDVGDDTFAIRDARGRRVVVLTDEETEFRVPGVKNPTIADLQVGDRVAGEGVIEGKESAPGQPVVRARLVVVLPEDVARLAGEVSAVEGATIVLRTRGGVVNVLTDGDTVFRVPGVEGAALDDIAVGDGVVAAGTWQDTTTFHAVAVGLRDSHREGRAGKVGGRVISVGADSLVIGTPNGPVTVLVSDETLIRVPGVEEPTLDDVEARVLVGAEGMWDGQGRLQARLLAVLRDGERRPAPKRLQPAP